MSINDVVDKRELFKAITGKEVGMENAPGIDFKVYSRSVDSVYLKIKKMQRNYNEYPEHSTSKYFAESFSKIEKAYLSRDIKAFNTSVSSLLIAIAYE